MICWCKSCDHKKCLTIGTVQSYSVNHQAIMLELTKPLRGNTMKQQVTFSMFVDAFRSIRPDNFSYDGLEVLFDYFEAWEDETGEPVELDVIEMCCDFQESSHEDIIRDYNVDTSGSTDLVGAVRDFLENSTILVGETDTGFVFASF